MHARAFLVLLVLLLPIVSDAKELRVVATLEGIADLARQVGGDTIRVDFLCRGTQDPHYLDARPSHMAMLNRADLLMVNVYLFPSSSIFQDRARQGRGFPVM